MRRDTKRLGRREEGEHLNTAEFLREQMIQKGYSKNELIRRTGIDRSTFYQIVGGRRMAAPEQFRSILKALSLSREEWLAAASLYEREQETPKESADNDRIRDFLAALDRGSEEEPGACPPVLLSFLERFAEHAGETDTLCIFATETLMNRFGILPTLQKLAAQKKEKLTISYLCASLRENFDLESALRGIRTYLQCMKNKRLVLSVWYPGDAVLQPCVTPFPYFILAGDELLVFREDGLQVVPVLDPPIIAAYQAHFARLTGAMKPSFCVNQAFEEELALMQRTYEQAVGLDVYFFTPVPCVQLIATDAQVLKYTGSRNMVAFRRTLEILGVREITKLSGAERLFGEKQITESGVRIPLEEEDLAAAEQVLRRRQGKTLFFANPERLCLPDDWAIFLFGGEYLLFMPAGEFDFEILVEDRNLAKAFHTFAVSRVSSVTPDLLENPLGEAGNEQTTS